MQNRNWLKSNTAQRRLFAGPITSFLRKTLPVVGWFACVGIWMALFLGLTGCASRSPVLCQEPVLPATPALSQTIPPVSYSLRVQQSLSKWEALLIGTPPMSKP